METSGNSIFKMITPIGETDTPISSAAPLLDLTEDNRHSEVKEKKSPATRQLMYKMSTEVSPPREESVDLLDLLGPSENIVSEGSNLPSSDEEIPQPVAPKVVKTVKPALKIASKVPLRSAPKQGAKPKVVKVTKDKPAVKPTPEVTKTPAKNTTKTNSVTPRVTVKPDSCPTETKPNPEKVLPVKQTQPMKESVCETVSMETLEAMVGVKRSIK